MSAPPPLLADLQRLGLPPGASPEQLKTAWRRAVSQWHPDRRGQPTDHALTEVNAAFQRLREFHRQNGRLPNHADLRATRAMPSPAPLRRARWALGASTLVVGLIVFWPFAEKPPALAPPVALTAAPEVDDAPIGRRPERLVTGMTADDVERLVGAPVFRSLERWEYGPSEIRFHRGRVSGWHSSPLRPLPVATINAASDSAD